MLKTNGIDIDAIEYHDSNNRHRQIVYVYYRGRKLWELIIGFLYDKTGYSLNSKDGFILKAKDQ